MRVLLVAAAWPSERHPAFGSFVQRLAEAVAARGVEVDRAVLTTRSRGRVATPAKYAGLGLVAAAHAVGRRPDVVWAHNLVPPGALARRVARLRRVPYVVTAHGTDVANAEGDERLRRATASVVADAAAVMAVSDDLAERLRALYDGLDGRLHVVSAGVDLARFHDGDRAVAAAALGWDAPEPRYVAVGNLVAVKNLERLLEAFARVRAGGSASLALVGDGPLAGALEEHAAALGVAGDVRLAGEVPADEVPRWLRAATAACLVSEREGLGLAALEALACGRPVAISQAAGASSVIEPGVTGARCDPLDVDSIAAALRDVAALRPGVAATIAAEPFALEREAARVVEILQASSDVTSKPRA